MPLSAPSESSPELARPAKQAARCPTCCVQPARRYWRRREDGADSGGAEEDEGAKEAPGLLCLHRVGSIVRGRTGGRQIRALRRALRRRG